jgi:glutathione peroxidase
MNRFGWIIALAITTGSGVLSLAQEDDAEKKVAKPAALNFKVKNIDGENVALTKYYGDVVLVVNVASQCGLTPQYEGLQALHEKYASKGLSILGFPCNQFGKQEPGTESEIKSFCRSKYDVEFDMFSKIDVNGDNRAGLYGYLTQFETKPQGPGDISWNFEKFLINRKGEVIARFSPRTKPDDKDLVKAIETALAEARPADASQSKDSKSEETKSGDSLPTSTKRGK